ncbi:hypothetical protein ACFPRL_01235 [Pseudoclavibacter helvolus]
MPIAEFRLAGEGEQLAVYLAELSPSVFTRDVSRLRVSCCHHGSRRVAHLEEPCLRRAAALAVALAHQRASGCGSPPIPVRACRRCTRASKRLSPGARASSRTRR